MIKRFFLRRKLQPISVYFYKLPAKFRPRRDHLKLLSETYYDVESFLKKYRVRDPEKADYFFVPLNLVQFQFENKDPRSVLAHLRYFEQGKRNHILVALGDFSQRSKKNHWGNAYKQVYDWINDFKLIALESTSDLIEGQDIGYVPANTFVDKTTSIIQGKRFLYSFLGTINHEFLPEDHVRKRVGHLTNKADVLIAESLDVETRRLLAGNETIKDDFELVARNSIFTLAIAGYGKWTYRFFQAIKWGSIPILVSDDYNPPFQNHIPYNEFVFRVPETEIQDIDNIVRSISAKEVEEMKASLLKYQHLFTKESIHGFLLESLTT